MTSPEKLKEILSKVKSGNVDELGKYIEDIETSNEIDPLINEIKNINGDIRSLDDQYKEQKRIYSNLINNLPGAVYRCENEFKWPFSYVSEGIKSFTGYSADDFITRKVFYGDIIADDYKQLVWDEVQRALEARIPFRLVYKIKHADGSDRWVWEQGSGVFNEDNELQFLEGFITEITDKIKLQADLETESEKIENINKAVTSRELELAKLKKTIEELKKLVK